MDGTHGSARQFRLAYAPGITPSKWARVWNQRMPDAPLELVQVPASDATRLLVDGDVGAALLRLPVDRDVLSAIPLYVEVSVVVVPVEHPIAAFESVTVADLVDEVVLDPADDVLAWSTPPGERSALARPATTAEAISLVASEVGLVVVPQSLARLHHRKDLTYRPVVDAPQSQVALCWATDRTTEEVDELIGIVRGRTVNSSRGRASASTPSAASPAAAVPAPARAHDDSADRREAQRRKAQAKGRNQSRGQAQARGQSRGHRAR